MKLFREKKSLITGPVAGITSIIPENIFKSNDGYHLSFTESSALRFELKSFIKLTAIIAEVILSFSEEGNNSVPKISITYNSSLPVVVADFKPSGDGLWKAYLPFPNLIKSTSISFQSANNTSNINITSLVAQKAALTDLIRHFHTIDANLRRYVVQAKTSIIIDQVGSLDHQFRHGNEEVNHAAIAYSVATAVLKPYSEIESAYHKRQVSPDIYSQIIKQSEILTPADADHMTATEKKWSIIPKFSILMPIYNPPIELLNESIDCLIAQNYQNWELCLADDASPNPEVRDLIERRAKKDNRIKYTFRKTNGHISEATNSCADLACGDFIVLMDNDDLLPTHALWTVAYYINKNPKVEILFSDEDKLSPEGKRIEPYLKGKFDRILMYGHNMFSHLGIYKKTLFDSVGRFRKGYEGSQDYDLTLRCVERCSEDQIVHIPHVLYHWRQIPGSTSISADQKNYAFDAALRAINDHFCRCSYPLEAVPSGTPGIAAIKTLTITNSPVISVVIPTRDNVEDLESCIKSIQLIGDPLLEIIIVNNASEDDKTILYFKHLKSREKNIKVIDADIEFNFSKLCNIGVDAASGDIICLLNNDTEFLGNSPFGRVRSWLSIEDIGIVGARLLYPDRSIQHFGVVTGVGQHGVAEHPYLGSGEFSHTNFSKSILTQQFAAVTAACLFMRKSDYQSIGGMDTNLPVAYNDVDLCLSIRRMGKKVICDTEIKLVHKESRTRGNDQDSSEKKLRLNRDAANIKDKWGEFIRDPFYSPYLTVRTANYSISPIPRIDIPWKA